MEVTKVIRAVVIIAAIKKEEFLIIHPLLEQIIIINET